MCTAEQLVQNYSFSAGDRCVLAMHECESSSPFNFFKLYFCTFGG
jgi:hypothetical protein